MGAQAAVFMSCKCWHKSAMISEDIYEVDKECPRLLIRVGVEEGDIGVEEEITDDMVNAEIQYDQDDNLGIVAGPVAAV